MMDLRVCVLVLLLPEVRGFQLDDGPERFCAFSNSLQGAEPVSTNELGGEVQENGTIRCSRSSCCYGLWEKRSDGEMKLLNQGCWTHVGHQQECHGDRCVLPEDPQVQRSSYRFCCCSQNFCNTNYTEAPPTADTPVLKHSHTDLWLSMKETALVVLVTVTMAAIVLLLLVLGLRVIRGRQKLSSSVEDLMEEIDSEEILNLKLVEARSSTSEKVSSCSLRPDSTLLSISESHLHGGVVSGGPVGLQLSEEDLEVSRLDPEQVNQNLRTSDEDLKELPQKQFGPEPEAFLQVAPREGQEPSTYIHLLPQQQILPQRPTSLHLLSRPKQSSSISSGLKVELRSRSTTRQVETGVAKMNTVMVSPAEPHLVTTVTNPRRYSAGVPVLVTNRMKQGGRANPAGPQGEEEASGAGGRSGGDLQGLLTFSPDEEEPLLRSEPPQNRSGRNSNNNNNHHLTLGSELSSPEPGPEPGSRITGSPGPEPLQGPSPTWCSNKGLGPDQRGPDPVFPETAAAQNLQVRSSGPEGAGASNPETNPGPPSLDPSDPENEAVQPEVPVLVQSQLRQTKVRRPERPCSLDLSSSSDGSVMDSGGLSSTGEKIRCRVKTPYTLKKWRPASWVPSADTDLDLVLDLEFSTTRNQTSSGPHSAGWVSTSRLKQSKSSMEVFLVGGATVTPGPDTTLF